MTDLFHLYGTVTIELKILNNAE